VQLGRDVPHILLFDEPTNHLDMESIDALAKAINEFEGGMVLVSHDMRLISQVAQEIWICDHKQITKYKGDIQRFKMDMRHAMGIEGEQGSSVLKGDASVRKKESSSVPQEEKKKPAPKLEVVAPPRKEATTNGGSKTYVTDDDDTTAATTTTSSATTRYVPPHLRKKMAESS